MLTRYLMEAFLGTYVVGGTIVLGLTTADAVMVFGWVTLAVTFFGLYLKLDSRIDEVAKEVAELKGNQGARDASRDDRGNPP